MSEFKVQVVDKDNSPFNNGDLFIVRYDERMGMESATFIRRIPNPDVKGAVNDINIGEFRRLYAKAKDEGLHSFEFEGTDVLTDYAKYLLEYVDIIEKGYGRKK